MLLAIQNPRFLIFQSRFQLNFTPKTLNPLSKRRLFHFSNALHSSQPLSAQLQTLSPTPSPPPTSQILETRKTLLSRERKAVEIAEEYLNRLRQTEPQIRSFLHVSENVIKEAEEIDRKIERNEELGPLAGVLVGVKDNICTVDMPSTGGSRILEGYRPAFDATAVSKLRECGAVIVGKTNMDEFGMGSTTEASSFQSSIEVRTLVQKNFKAALDQNDILISPAAPSAAYKIGEKKNDPLAMYAGDIMTVNVNLAGLPALVLPCGFVDGGPAGLQIIGAAFDEGKLVRVGHIFEQTLQGCRFIPPSV